MKIVFCTLALVMVWVSSAPAAMLYLKDGGRIKAWKVWREKGTVVALLNRDSIARFAVAEVNLKKTFPPRKKRIAPVAAPAPAPATQSATVAGEKGEVAAAPAKESKKRTLPSLPALSGKLPERELPKGSEEGTLRKQKREMQERLND